MTLIDDAALAEMRAIIDTVGDGKMRPTGPYGRMRYCTRCDRMASEFERHDPSWVPPLAHSWASMGRVYWTDLCKPCLDFDKRRREAMRGPAANADGSPKPVLGMHWSERTER